MNKLTTWIGLVVLIVASSCSGDRVFEEFHSINTSSWNDRDSIVFDLSDLKEKKAVKI